MTAMNPKPLPALVGAAAGLVGYMVGRFAIGTAVGEVARGAPIGVNAAANLGLASCLPEGRRRRQPELPAHRFQHGNFGFIDRQGSVSYIEHEAGHALNLAAFGSVFHHIGAADENLLGGHDAALSEALAESNNPNPRFSVLAMWR